MTNQSKDLKTEFSKLETVDVFWETVMNDITLQQIYNFAQEYHAKDKSGHGFDHIKRVYENACKLLQNEPRADAFIVKAAALLHDIDDHKMNTDGNEARRFLQSIKMENALIEQILATVDAIGFSKSGSSPEFATLEQALVSDADKLDAMGAMGICRTLAFGAANGRPIFDYQTFPKENLSKEEYKNMERKENNSINHFFDKLLLLKNAIQSEAGKKEAQKRHDYMVGFLEQFFAEQNLDDWRAYLANYLRQKI